MPARPPGAIGLAVGIVALEFAAAVTSFVTSTLLPLITRDLNAHSQLAMLLAGSTLGMFIALPLAGRIVRWLGGRRTLTVGMAGYVGGLAVAATAGNAWVFALGQFVGGAASGLLAVFGISSAIQHFDEGLRVRVVAASSAMWIVPALVGPAATLGLEHLVGWRWTLLAPVPVVLVGRLLVVRAARPDQQEQGGHRPLGRTLLIPLGVTALMLGTGRWPLQVAGAAVALLGIATIMPPGTATVRRGTPAALGALLLFAVGYFGADSLITLMLTGGYHTSIAGAAIVLSAAPLAWALTSLAAPRLGRNHHLRHLPSLGLGLTALGVGALAVALIVSPSFGVALTAWTAAGVGVGLAYPGLYIRATTAGASGFTATQLATAAITAEAFGGLLGRAAGGAISSLDTPGGLIASYLMFAAVLLAAAVAATRTSRRTDAAHRG
jgi:MFS family permease